MARFSGVSLFVLVVVFSFLLQGGESKDLYVNVSSAQSSEEGTQDNPFLDLKSALEGASFGDRILVADGTYSGTSNRDLSVTFPLEIRALDFDNRPIIDLQSAGAFATFDPEQSKPEGASSSALLGFIFHSGKGTGDSGSVLTIKSGSFSIGDCEFKGNVAEDGGAVVLASPDTPSGTPNLVGFGGCTWISNQGDQGAALRLYPHEGRTVVVGGCKFIQNTASITGGAIYSEDSSLIVAASNFTANVAEFSFGGAVTTIQETSTFTVSIYSSRFLQNDGAGVGGGVYSEGGIYITGSVFQENLLHDVDTEPRQGAGLYVIGSAIIEGSSFENNNAGTDENGSGGGLVLDGEGTSYVSNSVFQQNEAHMGSDVAVLSGTAYFTQSTFKKSDFEGDYQLSTTGQVLFENCFFQQLEGKQSLLSLHTSGSGSMDFEWSGEDVDFLVGYVTIADDGVLKTSSNLNVTACVMHGGLILSTSTANRRKLGILVSMTVTPVSDQASLGISGFDVINYGDFTVSAGKTFSADEGRGTFTNQGQLVLQKGSLLSGMQKVVNNHLLQIQTRAGINSGVVSAAGANIELLDVGSSSSTALVIAGYASLDGNLTVRLVDSKDFDKGRSKFPLLSYTSLTGVFRSYSVTPTVKQSSLLYDPFVLYLSNQKDGGSSGLSGGEVALTVIGALVGVFILGVAIWYFWVRNPNTEDAFSILGGPVQ